MKRKRAKFDPLTLGALQEMFRRVGLSDTPASIRRYTNREFWFHRKTWTLAEGDDFLDWLTAYYQTKTHLNKKYARKAALWFDLTCGWKIRPKQDRVSLKAIFDPRG